jgi:hypothetical protein
MVEPESFKKTGSNMPNKILLSLIATVLLLPAYTIAAEEPLSHEEEVTAYRERREAGLQRPTGWLTLVGLHWPGRPALAGRGRQSDWRRRR